MSQEFTMLINGKSVKGVSTFDVIDPATGKAFAQCPKADAKQLNEAVAAAKAAFPAWSATPIEERAAAVQRISEKLEARVQEFASLLTHEQGKPTDQAMYEMMAPSSPCALS